MMRAMTPKAMEAMDMADYERYESVAAPFAARQCVSQTDHPLEGQT